MISKHVDTIILENEPEANYTITVVNTGYGNAFNVTIADNFLELYRNYGNISNDHVIWSNGTRLNLDSSQITSLFNTSQGLNLGVLYGIGKSDLNPNYSNNFTLYYTVIFNVNPQPDEIINNTAMITQFYSTSSSSNNYVTNDTYYHV